MKKRLLSLILAGLLAVSLSAPYLGASPVFAASDEPVEEADKTESVYVKADASGKSKEVEVDVKLKKDAGGKAVADVSDLSDIRNLDGDEEYRTRPLTPDESADNRTGAWWIGNSPAASGSAASGSGASGSGGAMQGLTWDNLGEAIRYSGKTDKELPVSVAITYYLDGKKTDPADLAGKSGHLKMRFDYENRTAVTLSPEDLPDNSGNENVETIIPFTAMTAVLLPSDVFSNIKITNGRLMELGSLSAMIGLAFPGLENVLKLKDWEETEDIDLPEYVELEADVTDFELAFTSTIFTSGLLTDLDLSGLDDLDDLDETLDDLKDATGKLADGSSALTDGLRTFNDYYSEYIGGAAQLGTGVNALNEGIGALDANKAALEDGAKALSDGLGQLDAALAGLTLPEGSGAIPGLDPAAIQNAMKALGADAQTVASVAQTVGAALPVLQNAAEVLKGLESSDDPSAPAQSPAVETALAELNAIALPALEDPTAQARSQAEASLTAALADPALTTDSETGASLTEEQKAAIVNAVIGSLDLSSANADSKTAVEAAAAHIEAARSALGEAQTAETDPADQESDSSEKNAQIEAVAQSLADCSASLGGSVESLGGTLTDMQAQLTALSTSLQALSQLESLGSSVASMAGMVDQLKGSVSALSEGSKGLAGGLTQFNGGISQLAGGSQKLAAGFAAFAQAGGLLGDGFGSAIDGSAKLSDGLKEFNDKAVEKIDDMDSDQITGLLDRFRALQAADKKLTSFTGLADGKTGSVKFIFETEAIE